jgi:hypothetical protein
MKLVDLVRAVVLGPNAKRAIKVGASDLELIELRRGHKLGQLDLMMVFHLFDLALQPKFLVLTHDLSLKKEFLLGEGQETLVFRVGLPEEGLLCVP